VINLFACEVILVLGHSLLYFCLFLAFSYAAEQANTMKQQQKLYSNPRNWRLNGQLALAYNSSNEF